MGKNSSPGSRLPAFAEDIAGAMFRDTRDRFDAAYPQGYGTGIFGDMLAGYQAGPTSQLFDGATGLMDPSNAAVQRYGSYGVNNPAIGAMERTAGWATPGAQSSANLNALSGNVIDAGSPGFQRLLALSGAGGGSGGGASPFQGQVAPAALAEMANVGVESDVFNRASSLARSQSDAAFAARGLGSSGAALQAGNDVVQRLADNEIMRVADQRAKLLGAAAQGEGANAAMTNALGSWDIGFGRNQIDAAQSAAALPSQIFATMQGGLGQGIQNLGQYNNLYMQPLQAARAGLDLTQAATLGDVQLRQNLYNLLRSPQTQILAALAGANPLQRSGAK